MIINYNYFWSHRRKCQQFHPSNGSTQKDKTAVRSPDIGLAIEWSEKFPFAEMDLKTEEDIDKCIGPISKKIGEIFESW